MTLRSVTARGITGAIATAMLATSATPAMADGYGGYGGGYRHHERHDEGIGAGGVIAGIAVIGLIAALASSGHRTHRGDTDGGRGDGGSENDAADACANTAQQRLGHDARVTTIDQVVRAYDGYQVSGIIAQRGYRYDDQQRFTCQVRYGNVERIDFSGSDAHGY